ncbi:BPG-independent [Laetiporus sulphureus 93-53]|uniref:BPG-independent n=1 Tax=Laetiporus sulphureus 93-53 TaxID=1314785 RepID=A0A165FE23_9APHY|nr:BPG-independent [Laetiporus sulphureus 93-53]KZT08830.1 BPG-independent [Laetiporus sulphureus 93-53]
MSNIVRTEWLSYAGLEATKQVGVPHVCIHSFDDGHDTAPRSAAGYVKGLLAFTEKEKYGQIATVIAVDGLAKGVGEKGEDTMKLIVANGDEGRIKDGDTLFFNYRSDQMWEIVVVLGLPDKPMEVDHISTMPQYNAEFPFPVAFAPQPTTNVLAEWLAKQGVKQAHIKPRNTHTFFSNGDVETQHVNEKWHMILSPKAAPYDKTSVKAIVDKVAEVIRKGDKEFVRCNFAPQDMKDSEEEKGALPDVTSAVLDIMGLPQPEEMPGRSLLAHDEEKKE